MPVVSKISGEPFRFWCQKVLPAVYDDSLSYYELLCKVVDYLNKVMEDDINVIELVNENEENFNTLKNFVDTYFDNLDVQEEINHKLDIMAEDGSLLAVVAPHLDEIIEEYEDTLDADLAEYKGTIDADVADFKSTVNTTLINQNTEITHFKNTINNQVSAQNAEISNFKTSINSTVTEQDYDISAMQSQMDNFINAHSDIQTFTELYNVAVTNGMHYEGQTIDLSDDYTKYTELDIYWQSSQSNKQKIRVNSAELATDGVELSWYIDFAGTTAQPAPLHIAMMKITNGNAAHTQLTLQSAYDEYWNGIASDNAVRNVSQTVGDYSAGAVYKIVGVEYQASAELNDIRVGANGVTYPTAGDSVRGQYNDLKNLLQETVLDKYILVKSVNRLNLETVTDGKILLKDGTEINSSGHFYTDYIECSEGDTIYAKYNGTLEVYTRAVACYDAYKNILSEKGTDVATLGNFTVPSGVSFVRITCNASDKTHIVISINERANSYVPYEPPYYKVSEDFLTEETKNLLNVINTDNYACSLPNLALRMTVGIPQAWYKSNISTPPSAYTDVDAGLGVSKRENDKFTFRNTNVLSSDIYYTWQMFDDGLNKLSDQGGDPQYGRGRHIVAENLQNCSLLVIGDSTVDHDTMTRTMLDYFTSKGKTLTLLGTLGDGTADNHNEGRAGWKATDYLTDRTYNGVVNPFYNPSTQTFDFGYYMTNQGYTAPDFIVIQLGINDLYYDHASAIESTWNAVQTMIDSIRTYNTNIKLLLNLPTPPNADDSKLSTCGFLYRNAVVRYAQYAMNKMRSVYGYASIIRPTYCHLILDPETDINDDVHPTTAGYAKMGLEVISQINCWQNGH